MITPKVRTTNFTNMWSKIVVDSSNVLIIKVNTPQPRTGKVFINALDITSKLKRKWTKRVVSYWVLDYYILTNVRIVMKIYTLYVGY